MKVENSDREEQLEKMKVNLEKAFPESTPKPPEEPIPDPEPKEKEVEPDVTDSTPEPEPKPESESEPKPDDTDDKGGKEPADDKPELSDAYYHAAKLSGWSDEDVDSLYKSNPELCVSTLSKIYEARNRATQDFAAIGRRVKEEAKIVPVVEPTPVVEPEAKSDYKGLDAEALRKKYPDDPMVDMIISMDQQNKLLHDQNAEQRNRPEPAIHAANSREQAAHSQEARAIEQQIDMFFNSDGIKVYGDFYGTVSDGALDWHDLTPGQQANRWAVLETMDQMVAGANACGKEISIDQALEYAHLSVSESEREKVIRSEIIGKVKQRSKGISLEPSGKAPEDKTGKQMTRAELVADTKAKMDKIFN